MTIAAANQHAMTTSKAVLALGFFTIATLAVPSAAQQKGSRTTASHAAASRTAASRTDKARPAKTPAAKSAPQSLQPLEIGKRLTHRVSLPDLDGNIVSTKDFVGRWTVVNFWSMTCPIMQTYEAKYNALQEDYAIKGVHFLHINANQTSGEIDDRKPAKPGDKPYQKIRDYLARYKLQRHVLIDRDAVLANILGAQTTPDVFVFDKTGTLVYRGLIDSNHHGKPTTKRTKHHLRNALNAVLAGKKPPSRATAPHGSAIQHTRVVAPSGSEVRKRKASHK